MNFSQLLRKLYGYIFAYILTYSLFLSFLLRIVLGISNNASSSSFSKIKKKTFSQYWILNIGQTLISDFIILFNFIFKCCMLQINILLWPKINHFYCYLISNKMTWDFLQIMTSSQYDILNYSAAFILLGNFRHLLLSFTKCSLVVAQVLELWSTQ